MKKDPILCIVGLGYVVLPLAAAFGKSGWKTYGFDINSAPIRTPKEGEYWTHEITTKDLAAATIEYSADPSVIGKADTIIVAVPTPVDEANKPDMTPVHKASVTVGKHMKKGTVVVYES